MNIVYRHPAVGSDGKRLSTANILWEPHFPMRAGKFPTNHPCVVAGSGPFEAFRQRGYWASCFPEGDGITLMWWDGVPNPTEKTAEQVMQDIAECFGWTVKQNNPL